MPRYTVRAAGVVIGHTELPAGARQQPYARGWLEPLPAFDRWPALLATYHDASAAAERQSHSVEERRELQRLVEESLGLQLLDARGHRVGRVQRLRTDAASGRVEVQVLFEPRPSGAG